MNRHEAVTKSYPIPGQTWPSELCWLYDTFRHSRRHVEIGVYCGRSLFASCVGMSHSKVLGVDIRTPADARLLFPSAEWVDKVRNSTIEEVQNVTEKVRIEIELKGSIASALSHRDDRFDSAFIDACHEFAEVSADIQSWLPLIKPGGILAGHDYWTKDVGVMDAVNELCPDFKLVPNTRIWYYQVT